MHENQVRGLVILNTGSGKGKTTAALGMALRAIGSGMKVMVRQFIKGAWVPGEVKVASKLDGLLDIRALGDGFLKKDASAEERAAMQVNVCALFAEVCEEIYNTDAALVILDEVLYCVHYGLLPESAVLDLIARKKPDMHLILTGRGATPALIDAADLVTEMQPVKHPYEQGIRAQRGIEF